MWTRDVDAAPSFTVQIAGCGCSQPHSLRVSPHARPLSSAARRRRVCACVHPPPDPANRARDRHNKLSVAPTAPPSDTQRSVTACWLPPCRRPPCCCRRALLPLAQQPRRRAQRAASSGLARPRAWCCRGGGGGGGPTGACGAVLGPAEQCAQQVAAPCTTHHTPPARGQHTHTHTHACTHARARTHTHTHTHTPQNTRTHTHAHLKFSP
jgi:hypothetical protein